MSTVLVLRGSYFIPMYPLICTIGKYWWNITCEGPRTKGSIALTFDDGPHPTYTNTILDTLAQKNVRATFFVSGQKILLNPQIVKRASAEGHEIGNHAFNHTYAFLQSLTKHLEEISTTKKLIEDCTGKPNLFYRPPYGIVTPTLRSICKQLGLTIVLWSINSYDYTRRPAASIIQHVIDRIAPGSIILFHDSHFKNSARDCSKTNHVLQNLCSYCAGHNLAPVTIGALLKP